MSLYQNDQWTLEDTFKMGKLGDSLAKITLQAPPPFAVRVTGKWGAGKTSTLRRAFVVLGGEPISKASPLGDDKAEVNESTLVELGNNWRTDWSSEKKAQAKNSMCVWYSPWQHQSAKNPLTPLLLEIREQFTRWGQVKQIFKNEKRAYGLATLKLFERAIDASVSLSFGKNMPLTSGTTETVQKTLKEERVDLSLSDGQRFHIMFEDAIEELLTSKADVENKENHAKAIEKPRLIIFIDDLDRCEESTVVGLLECIKLYLSTQNCVFVFGLDDSAVLNALNRHWSERGKNENREYLEKLFQATLFVPPPDPVQLEENLTAQLEAHEFYHPLGVAAVIDKLIEPNPRKIKNFTNSLCASWDALQEKASAPKLVEEAKNDVDGMTIAKLELYLIVFTYLRLYHRNVWRILERQPASFTILRELLTRAAREDSQHFEKLDDLAQEMTREFFFSSFSHVLDK